MNKLYLNWKTIDQYCNKLAIQILKSEWKPDYIVGIGRGGLVPAVILSHILDVPMHSLKVTLRDGVEEDCDHNCWMADDAIGYVASEDRELIKSRWDSKFQKNILIIDDINDTGTTLSKWPDNNVAVIHRRKTSKREDTYHYLVIKDEWIIYPWETLKTSKLDRKS